MLCKYLNDLWTRFMIKNCVFLLICAFALSACAGAKIFYQDQQGGILVVVGSEEGMMEAAREKMNAHCGSLGFTIIKRYTVVVGSESYSQTNYQDTATENKTKAQSAKASSEDKTHQNETSSQATSKASERSVSKEASKKQTTGEEVSVSSTRDLTEHRVAYRCGN